MAFAFMTLVVAFAGTMPRGGVADLQGFVKGSMGKWVGSGEALYRAADKRLTALRGLAVPKSNIPGAVC